MASRHPGIWERTQRGLAKLPEVGLSLLVVGSALAIGAVHPVSSVAVALVAAAFTVAAVVDAGRAGGSTRLPWLVGALALAGAWCLVQTVPLGGLAARGSPSVAELWRLADTATAYVSGNLEATRVAGLRYLLYATLLTGAVAWFRRSDRVRALADVLIVSAVVVAVIGFVQSWLRTDTILFLYEPVMGPVREGVHGPFVNPDHFGAYTAMGALLAISRGALLQVHRRRFLDYGVGIVLAAATIVSLSLSAMLGLAVGLVWLTAVWSRRQRKLGDLLGVTVGIGVAAGFLALMSVALGVTPSPEDAVVGQIEGGSQMVAVWAEAFRLTLEAPLTGIGSGTLPDLLGTRLGGPETSFWFARNQPLQSVLDLGWIVGLALGVAALAALRSVFVRWPQDRLATMLPVVVALIGLLVTSLVDFALEIPAIGIVAALLAGAIYAQARGLNGRRRSGSRPVRRIGGWRRLGLPVALPLAALTLGAGLWALLTGVESASALARVEAIAHGQLGPEAGDATEALEAAARQRLAVRPGQARVYTLVGRGFLAHDDPARAIPWLESAATLRPSDRLTRQLYALAELRLGNLPQAIAQVEHAIALDPDSSAEILGMVVEETDDLTVWLAMTPSADRRRTLVSQLLGDDRALDGLRYASALLEAEPDSAAGFEAGARAAFELGIDELAEYYAENLARVEPDSLRAQVIQARVELRRDEVDAAAERIERLLSEEPDDYGVWYALGELLVHRLETGGQPDTIVPQMREVRVRLRAVALADTDLSIEFHRLSARFYLAVANWRAASSAAALGIDAGGEQADLFAMRGLALLELHDLAGAITALRRAIELGSTDPRVVAAWARIGAGEAE